MAAFGLLRRALGRRLFDRHRSIWHELPLTEDMPARPPRFDGRLVFDEQQRVLEFIERVRVPGTCDPIELRTMRERGHLFVGIQDGERMIGFCKVGWGVVYVLDYRIDLVLPPRSFFVIDLWVMPDMRGRGAATFAFAGTSIEMRRRGFERRIAHIKTNNKTMLHVAGGVGYRELGRVDYFSILGKKIFLPHPATLLLPRFRTASPGAEVGAPLATPASTAPELSAQRGHGQLDGVLSLGGHGLHLHAHGTRTILRLTVASGASSRTR